MLPQNGHASDEKSEEKQKDRRQHSDEVIKISSRKAFEIDGDRDQSCDCYRAVVSPPACRVSSLLLELPDCKSKSRRENEWREIGDRSNCGLVDESRFVQRQQNDRADGNDCDDVSLKESSSRSEQTQANDRG